MKNRKIIKTVILILLLTSSLFQSSFSLVRASVYGYKPISVGLNTSIDELIDDIYIRIDCNSSYRYKIFPIDSNLYCKPTDSKYKHGYCTSTYDSSLDIVNTFIPPRPEMPSDVTLPISCYLYIEKFDSTYIEVNGSIFEIDYYPDYSSNLINIFPSQAIVTSNFTLEMLFNISSTPVTVEKISIGEYSKVISNSYTSTDPSFTSNFLVLTIDSFTELTHYSSGGIMRPGFYRDIYVLTNYGLTYYTASTSILYTNSSSELDYWDLEIIGYITETRAFLNSGLIFQGLETGNQLLEITGYLGDLEDPVNIYIGNSADSNTNYCVEISRTMLSGLDLGKMTIICQTTTIDKTIPNYILPPKGGKVDSATSDLSDNLNKIYMNFGEITMMSVLNSNLTIKGVFNPLSSFYRFNFNILIADFNYITNSSTNYEMVDNNPSTFPFDFYRERYSPTQYLSYGSYGWVNMDSSSSIYEEISVSIYYGGSFKLNYARLGIESCSDSLATDCDNTAFTVPPTLDYNKAWQIYTFDVSSATGSIDITCSGFITKTLNYNFDFTYNNSHLAYLVYFSMKEMGIITDNDSEDNELRFLAYFRLFDLPGDGFDFVIEINYPEKISFTCNSGCTVYIMKQFNHNESRRFVDADLIRMPYYDFSNSLNRQLLVYYSDTISEKTRATCDSNECMFQVQDANYYPIITNVDITYVSISTINLILKYVITTSDFGNYDNSDNDTHILIGDNSIQEGVSNTTFQYSSRVFTIEEVSLNLDNTIQYPQIITKYGILKVTANLYNCDANSTQGTTIKSASISSVNVDINLSFCTCTNGLLGNDVSCLINTDEQLKYNFVSSSVSLYILCDASEYAWEGSCLTKCPIYSGITNFTYNTIDYNYCILCTGSQMALRNVCSDSCDTIESIAIHSECNCNYCLLCSGITPYTYQSICYEQCPSKTTHNEGSYECYSCPYFYDLDTELCVEECQESQISDNNKKECITCNEPAIYRHYESNNCVENCPQGYIINNDNFICEYVNEDIFITTLLLINAQSIIKLMKAQKYVTYVQI